MTGYIDIESFRANFISLGQRRLGGCHGNLGIDDDSLSSLTSDHPYYGSSEPEWKAKRKGNILNELECTIINTFK